MSAVPPATGAAAAHDLRRRIARTAADGLAGWPVSSESVARLARGNGVDSDPVLALALLRVGDDGGTPARAAAARALDPYDVFAPANRLRLHSCAVRDVAERVADEVGADRGAVRTVALLHDVGKVALSRELDAYAVELAGSPEARAGHERSVFGTDHAEAGAWLASDCALPDQIVAGIAGHHRADASGEAALVRVADMLVHYREGRTIDLDELRRASAAAGLRTEQLGALMYDLAEPLPAEREPT